MIGARTALLSRAHLGPPQDTLNSPSSYLLALLGLHRGTRMGVRLASIDVVVFALLGISLGILFQAPVLLSSTLYRGLPLSLIFWNEQLHSTKA